MALTLRTLTVATLQDVESLRELEQAEGAWFSLPMEDADLRTFTVSILGPDAYDPHFQVSLPEGAAEGSRRASPYAGGVFRVELSTPAEYPLPEGAPGVRFITGIAHPLIHNQLLCKEVLQEAWRDPWEAPADAVLELGGAPIHPNLKALEAPSGGRHLLTLLLFLRKLMVKPQEDFARGLGECKALIRVREDKGLDLDEFDRVVRACTEKFAKSEDD